MGFFAVIFWLQADIEPTTRIYRSRELACSVVDQVRKTIGGQANAYELIERGGYMIPLLELSRLDCLKEIK